MAQLCGGACRAARQRPAVGSRLDVCLRRGAQLDPHDANQQAAALCLPSASHFMPLWPVHVRVPCGVCSSKARFVFSPAGRSTRAVGRGMRRLAYTPKDRLQPRSPARRAARPKYAPHPGFGCTPRRKFVIQPYQNSSALWGYVVFLGVLSMSKPIVIDWQWLFCVRFKPPKVDLTYHHLYHCSHAVMPKCPCGLF